MAWVRTVALRGMSSARCGVIATMSFNSLTFFVLETSGGPFATMQNGKTHTFDATLPDLPAASVPCCFFCTFNLILRGDRWLRGARPELKPFAVDAGRTRRAHSKANSSMFIRPITLLVLRQIRGRPSREHALYESMLRQPKKCRQTPSFLHPLVLYFLLT